MFSRKILLNTIDDVKKLCDIVTKFCFSIDLVSGRYVVDAKSIVGIFSLDLSKEIEIQAHTEDEAAANELFELLSFVIR